MNERLIRPLTEADLPDALALIWQVFLQFEAPEYSAEGVAEFKAFIEEENVRQTIGRGELRLWGCYHRADVAGVLALRPPAHISLLFVDQRYHRQGIAKDLLSILDAQLPLTVNSSPYAVRVYERMGFTAIAKEQLVNGIRFIPMKKERR